MHRGILSPNGLEARRQGVLQLVMLTNTLGDMYGIFHVELQNYIETRYGHELWRATLKQTGLQHRFYMTVSTYLDSEAFAIVEAVSELTGASKATLFEDFGVFIAPTLMKTHEPLINPKWGLAEFLLNVEEAIHRVVRLKNMGAKPPRLKFEQIGPNELHFYYDSPRRMEALARGILKGIARHYGETVAIEEWKNPDGSVDMRITIR